MLGNLKVHAWVLHAAGLKLTCMPDTFSPPHLPLDDIGRSWERTFLLVFTIPSRERAPRIIGSCHGPRRRWHDDLTTK